MKNFDKNRQALDFLVLGGTVGIISILTLTFLPEKFTISPLVLFGVIFLSNITALLIPDAASERSAIIFPHRFFVRLALSAAFAILLIFISNFAQRF